MTMMRTLGMSLVRATMNMIHCVLLETSRDQGHVPMPLPTLPGPPRI